MPKRPARKQAAKKPVHIRDDLAGSWTPEQIAAGQKAKKKFERATAPAVLDALFPDGAKIGGKKAIPLTISSYTFLERLGNPITEPAEPVLDTQGKPVLDAQGNPKTKGGFADMNNERLLELCFVLTHPLRDLWDIYDEGANAWRDAIYEFGENIPMEDLASTGQAIGALIAQAMSTVTPTAPEKKTKPMAATSTPKTPSAAEATA